MNRLFYLLITTILLIFLACKPDSSVDKSDTNIKSDRILEMHKRDIIKNSAESKVNVPELRSQALSILNYRLKKHPETYQIVDHDLWEYKFVFDGDISPPGKYNGVWIDFKEDHTYDYGNRDKVEGGGRYNYQLERGEILLVDNDNSKKPQEFTAKIANDVMILQGTSTYNDRHVQMKLENVYDDIKKPRK